MDIGDVLSLLKSPAIWMMLALGLVGNMDLEEAVQQNKTYCEMVKLYADSDGENGWPAYNPDIECPQIATPRDQPADLNTESTSSSSM